MSDTTPEPLSPREQNAIAFELAQKALRYMGMLLAPLVVAGGFLGYGGYQDLKNKYNEQTAQLKAETQKTTARADTLGKLLALLRDTMHVRAAELANNSQEAGETRKRLQDFQLELARQTLNLQSNMQSQVRSAVDGANATSRDLRQRYATLDSQTLSRVRQLTDTANAANERAHEAVRIAREARVQTVGADHRQVLYGTPYQVSFSGVQGNSLRNFKVFDRQGTLQKEVALQESHEVIPLPDAGNPTHYIEIINVLDIPGGLLRLNGSSRADAATFRVTEATDYRRATLTAAH